MLPICLSIGAVLVFMPGMAEIKMLYEQLQSNRLFNNRKGNRFVCGKVCAVATLCVRVSEIRACHFPIPQRINYCFIMHLEVRDYRFTFFIGYFLKSFKIFCVCHTYSTHIHLLSGKT